MARPLLFKLVMQLLAATGKTGDVTTLEPPHPARRHRHLNVILVGCLAAITVAAVGITIDVARRVPVRPAPLITLSPVTKGRIVGTVRAQGVIAPSELATVSQTISGRLTRINVKAGEHVTAGQILARFDSLALQAEFARAEARAVSAEVAALEAEVELIRHRIRQSEGFPGPSMPEDEESAGADEVLMARAAGAAAEVQASEAAHRLARNRLRQGVVRAPRSGLILERRHNEGDVVTSGAVLFTIASDLNALQIEASIPEWSSGPVAVGQKVELTVPAFPGRRFQGEVRRLLPFAGVENERRLPVIVSIAAEAAGDLRPGMTAALVIRTSPADPVLRVPSAALVFSPRGMQPENESPSVWLAGESGHDLRQVAVEVGAMDGGFAEVRGEGLREGAAVAIGYVATK